MARHVFLSFVEEDLNLVNLFRGLAKNANNDLEFDDYSVKVPYNSKDADYIKQQIRNKIDGASVTVCLIGHSTHKSEWVDWEIVASNSKKKGIVGVRLHSSALDIPPPFLKSTGAKIVDWSITDIVRAIENA